MSWTKEQRADYMKKWREENKAHVKKYRHNYYVESRINGKYVPPNREDNTKRARKWREKNPDKYREYQRKYQSELRRIKSIDKCAKV